MSKKLENRKQKARELRSTHFFLGDENVFLDNGKVSGINSEYIDEYKKWQIDNEQNYGNKLGLKQSHFVFGTDSMREPYQSIYKRDHVQFDKVAVSTLDNELLKDLKGHHFELGTEKGLPQTEAQENFINRELPKGIREEFEQVVKRNKAQNLDFPDKGNYFSSIYNEKYNKNLDFNPSQRGIDRIEIKKQMQALQSSNIIFGDEREDYETSMRNAFASKQARHEKNKSVNLNQSNFIPGDDIGPTESMYKHFHKQFPIEMTKLNDEVKNDLRAHHFKFGDKQLNYESTASGAFKEPGADNYKNKERNPLLYQKNFGLGEFKSDYQTTYTAAHHEKTVERPNRANDAWRDRSSNIILGYAPTENKSEAQSQFVLYQGVKTTHLDEKLSKDLKQSHFKFDGPTQYESYSHAVYKDVLDKAKEINPRGIVNELRNDLGRNHFDYGSDMNQYKTSNRDAFKGLGGNSSEFSKNLKSDLRKNHFSIGNGQLDKDTTYRVNFDWKVAEDD